MARPGRSAWQRLRPGRAGLRHIRLQHKYTPSAAEPAETACFGKDEEGGHVDHDEHKVCEDEQPTTEAELEHGGDWRDTIDEQREGGR